MRVLWTADKTAILLQMTEAGRPMEEITATLGRSRDACVGKLNRMKNRGPNKRDFAKGVSAGVTTLSGRTIAKPKSDKSCIRACLCCGNDFRSWDRAKNQRCSRCREMQDPGPYAL